jgi:hypothetical protein
MLSYEVTLQVVPELAQQVEEHMRREHIPEIFATGCFHQIRFCRASPARFRTSYEASSQEHLDRYLRDHAPRMRADFQRRFSEGATLTREIWLEQERWT